MPEFHAVQLSLLGPGITPLNCTNVTFESVMWLKERGGKRGWREEELLKHDRSFLTCYSF